MRITTITQRTDGGPAVKITAMALDRDHARVVNHTGASAPNYWARTMGEQGLIPSNLVDRASDGWLEISCASADEATEISARIEEATASALSTARIIRRKRVIEYLSALIDAGKPVYVRSANGRFAEVL